MTRTGTFVGTRITAQSALCGGRVWQARLRQFAQVAWACQRFAVLLVLIFALQAPVAIAQGEVGQIKNGQAKIAQSEVGQAKNETK